MYENGKGKQYHLPYKIEAVGKNINEVREGMDDNSW